MSPHVTPGSTHHTAILHSALVACTHVRLYVCVLCIVSSCHCNCEGLPSSNWHRPLYCTHNVQHMQGSDKPVQCGMVLSINSARLSVPNLDVSFHASSVCWEYHTPQSILHANTCNNHSDQSIHSSVSALT